MNIIDIFIGFILFIVGFVSPFILLIGLSYLSPIKKNCGSCAYYLRCYSLCVIDRNNVTDTDFDDYCYRYQDFTEY